MSSFEPPLSNVVKSLTILMMGKIYDVGLNFLPKGAMIYFLSFRKGSANPLDSRYLFVWNVRIRNIDPNKKIQLVANYR